MPVTPTVWRPGAARIVTLDALPVARGAPVRAPALPSWPAKDPADVLDYQFDVSPGTHDNDGVATLDVTITPAAPGGLQLVSAAADGGRAVLWLGGGAAGTTYAVTLTLGTRAGRTLARTVLLPVLRLTATGTGADPLHTETGAPVTDGAGQPLTVGG